MPLELHHDNEHLLNGCDTRRIMPIIKPQLSSAIFLAARQLVQDNTNTGAPPRVWVPVAAVGGFLVVVTVPLAIWGNSRKMKKARKRREEEQKRLEDMIEERIRRAIMHEPVGGRVELQTGPEAQQVPGASTSPPELPAPAISFEISGALDPQELPASRRPLQELPAESSIQASLELDGSRRL